MSKRLVFGVALVVALAGAAVAFLRTSDDPLQIQPVAAVKAEDPSIGSLVIWDKYLAWMGIPDPSGKNSRVLLYDLDTKKTKTVASNIYGGTLSWVRASKDTILYLAFDHLACDDQEEKERVSSRCSSQSRGWKLMAKDVKTGKTKQIAKSSNELQQTYPILPEIEWPYVIWTDPSSAGTSTPQSRGIVVYDLRENKSKVLVPGAITGRATINQGNVIFSAAVPGPNKWDLFTVPANGSKPSRKLTSSGKVVWPRAASGTIVWQEYSKTKKEPQPPPEASVWMLPIKGKDEPQRVVEKGGNPLSGEGFVMWMAPARAGGQLLLASMDDLKHPVVVEQQPAFGTGWWADGNRVAWASFQLMPGQQKATFTIHVAEVG